MATQPQLRRLQRIEVDGLFGIYDHRFDLQLESRITLLHGPNGVGKTTILKMVDALLTERFGDFRTIPFNRLLLAFEDGAVLEVNKEYAKGDAEAGDVRLTVNGTSKTAAVSFTTAGADAIAAQFEFIQPMGEDVWMDVRSGELLTEAEVVALYGRRRGPLSQAKAASAREDASWLGEFLGAAQSHFIEAQRLVRSRFFPAWRRMQEPPISRVVECSRDLKRRIDDTMADYGRRAQSLDQSFPQRLLRLQRDATQGNLPVAEIRDRMSKLDQRMDELKEIGILDETPMHRFQVVDDIDASQAGVMTLYVQDTEEKLQVLEDLAKRVRLLLESLNGKFRHKQVQVDRTAGLAVAGKANGTLSLDSLSSGEQHELILHYDLLFRVPSNTVVLLDEPELSLHIEWQSRFLDDLMAIVQLSQFDALVATHSPYIVGSRDELMVELSG